MQPVAPPLLEDDELDLRAYVAVLRRRWRVILLTTLVAFAAVTGLSSREAATYKAHVEILINQNDATGLAPDAVGVNASEAERRLNNEVRLFRSAAVREAVAEAYDGPLNPDKVKASVTSDTSDVIQATLTGQNPEAITELVNVYADTFIEARRQQRTDELLSVGTVIQQKIDDLTEQIATLRQPLTDVEGQLNADPGNQALQSRRESLTAQLTPQIASLESRRSFYESQNEDLQLTANIAQSAGAQVLNNAEAPENPVAPKPLRNGLVAGVLGFLLGVGLAFMLEALDDRIRTVADLEEATNGLPTLALIPAVEKGHDERFVATRDDARSAQAEAYRSLRTAVKFASLDHPIKVLQMTSPSQGEGKTTAIANLAIALAQGGDRVAVVCCDLRRPRVQDRFGVGLTPGFTDVLVGDAPLADALRRYEPNVLILPAGTPPPNPSELLSSTKAAAVIRALAEEFDVVLIDSTPVLPVTDAMVVSRLVDATVVVADSRSTPRKAVRRTLQLLAQVNAPVLGVVLNGLPEGGGYGYGYGYTYQAEAPSRGRWRRQPQEA